MWRGRGGGNLPSPINPILGEEQSDGVLGKDTILYFVLFSSFVRNLCPFRSVDSSGQIELPNIIPNGGVPLAILFRGLIWLVSFSLSLGPVGGWKIRFDERASGQNQMSQGLFLEKFKTARWLRTF